ncbi:MAG: pitrilysin family protein [Patescibacteria group bacterium]
MTLQETIRDDGLHIITCRVPSKKTYMRLTAKIGSAYDPVSQQGLFHYFEHMAFKGTVQRNAADIKSFSRRFLLYSNATTGRIETRYFGETVHKKFGAICDLLCDLFFNSIFPPEEIEREKEVVLLEIARDYDNDQYVAAWMLWRNLWQQNPLAIFGVGTPEGVNSINRDLLLEAQKKWYIPSNTIAIATGNVHHDDFVTRLDKHIPRNKRVVMGKSWDDEYEILPLQQEVIVDRPKREKAIIIFGCKFPTHASPRQEIIEKFLEYILVKGPASLLWSELREKRGLTYSMSGGISGTYQLGSYFYVRVETSPSRIKEVCELIPEVLFKPITDSCMFEETKEHLYDWFTLGCDDNEDYANLIAAALIKKSNLKSLHHYFPNHCKIISSISLEEVEEMRQRTLNPERFVTVIMKSS